ncbi:DUF4383 domain-containing protein [Amycolatopsis pigmentata]|uniref:DUF4383 domain-containing protein n=1 Tax=Amycolatopsis pigmentata TaxID=450801 RepID=A0ABW5FRB4_9PSEU
MTTTTVPASGTVNRIAGFGFGAVFLLVGVIGFAITTETPFTATHGKMLLFFELNPTHDLVHAGVGIALAGAAGIGAGWAKAANTLIGGVYLLVGLAGFFLLHAPVNLLAVNHPDNVLHVLAGALLVGVGVVRLPRPSEDRDDVEEAAEPDA